MSVHELLIEALDELSNKDFKTFKWYLSTNLLDGCKPIPGHRLENAERTDTVTQITKSYGNETAVTISVKILRKMNQNTAALALEKAYAGTAHECFSTLSDERLFLSFVEIFLIYLKSLRKEKELHQPPVPQLLLTFKWYLSTNLLDGCKPIPSHRLEKAERTDTVTQITKSYGNETAVTISVKILRKMNQNTAALALEKAYAGTAHECFSTLSDERLANKPRLLSLMKTMK
uniref:Pyrin domain-containing protein n=1 Tax=Sphaeramia orbicularis TaxID=375764 RepID=A0A672ZWU1_9TELE